MGQPRRQPLFRGWTMLAIAALAMVGTLPGRTQGLGLVTESLLRDMHTGRISYAAINLWATIIGAAFCLPCGRLIDRFGSRPILTAVLLALGATVVSMSLVQNLAALSVAITLTRGFGQSALSVVSLTLVGKWFKRKLNYAMGIYSLLVGVGFITAFPSVGQAVLRFGWRPTWAGIGWILLLVFVPLAWILVRDHPEDSGLAPDGEEASQSPAGADLSLGAALRSPAFWVFALSSSVFGLVYSGIALFNESILAQRGFGPSMFHAVLAISALTGLIANFAGGWLASRWSIQGLMAIGMAVLAAALIALPLVQAQWHVVLYGMTMGIAGGIVTVVFFSVWGQAFGRTHLGRIQGAAQTMTVLASAIGPLLLAEVFERTGSYNPIFYGLALVVATLGVSCWFVRMPGANQHLLSALDDQVLS